MLATLPSRSNAATPRDALRWLDEVGAILLLVAAVAVIAAAGFESQAVAGPSVAALPAFVG